MFENVCCFYANTAYGATGGNAKQFQPHLGGGEKRRKHVRY